MEQQPVLNEHNKEEFPPMHTTEHILNTTMVKMFGCRRSKNAHIERKKSKCDYQLSSCPSNEEIQQIEDRVNEIIQQHLPVKIDFVTQEEAHKIEHLDLTKLPEDVSEMLRIVRIGDYDVCACIGQHVTNTSEIGIFRIISYDWNDGTLRIRFKLSK